MRICLISGYSNAGKTSTIEALVNQSKPSYYSYNKISTSDMLHECLARLYKLAGLQQLNSSYLTKSLYVMFGVKQYNHGRELLISLAEDVLVPTFGRGLFAVGCTHRLSYNHVNLIETIGGDEYQHLIEQIRTKYPNADILRVNIRRTEEQPDADIRQLIIGGIDIWNWGSIDDTVEQMEKLFSTREWWFK